jgi:diguanylate cyclase (GGDEF)-like protein
MNSGTGQSVVLVDSKGKMSEKKIKKKGDSRDRTVVDKEKAALKRVEPQYNVMLTVVQGSEADFGKTYTPSGHCIRIGRDKTSTIRLDDQKISKKHCEISIFKANHLEQIIIRDLNSTNGTYVNGELIQQWILSPGDKITVGETVLRFNYSDEIEKEYHARLFNFAAVDSLTGLYNRRYILNEMENQRRIAKRNERVFSIVVIDIDDFKQVNDTFGHSAGDEYLKQTGDVIKHTLREQDIAGRLGGEEFLIILPETGLNGALRLANRIRQQIEETGLDYQGNTIKATISAGVAQYKPDPASTPPGAEQLFQQADNALYKAKKSGKNKVVKADTGT